MLERYYGSKKEFENYLNKTYDPVKFIRFVSKLLQRSKKDE